MLNINQIRQYCAIKNIEITETKVYDDVLINSGRVKPTEDDFYQTYIYFRKTNDKRCWTNVWFNVTDMTEHNGEQYPRFVEFYNCNNGASQKGIKRQLDFSFMVKTTIEKHNNK